MELKSDYIIIVPPNHLVERMGITVIDYTGEREKRLLHVALYKVKEQVFAAHLQGYNVASEEKDGFIFIRIVNKEESKRIYQEYQLQKREKA